MQKPSIGRIVQYTNLGDADGKYPPEIQAALITGVYKKNPNFNDVVSGTNGQNDPEKIGLVPANKLGDTSESNFVDLTVFYRTGYFQIKCVPMAPEGEQARGCWNWPARV